MSRDAITVATLIASLAMLSALAGTMVEEAARYMEFCISICARSDILAAGAELAQQGVMVIVRTTVPLLAVTALCAVVLTFFQTRLLVTSELIKPKLKNLNPINGFKKLFSLKNLVETLKNILKIIILLVIIYNNLIYLMEESYKYLYVDVSNAIVHLFDVTSRMATQITLAFIALATADFFYQRWEFERNMRMSKEEIKEEYKQTEGDPKVKSKIREIQQQRSRMRMMQQVPQADVIIRNPTHFAVALRYRPEEDNAPIVLAKGQDSLAARIIKIAEENHIAVIENVPLARALYAEAELDREIPASLYGPVAEVLVYIFRLNEDRKIVK